MKHRMNSISADVVKHPLLVHRFQATVGSDMHLRTSHNLLPFTSVVGDHLEKCFTTVLLSAFLLLNSLTGSHLQIHTLHISTHNNIPRHRAKVRSIRLRMACRILLEGKGKDVDSLLVINSHVGQIDGNHRSKCLGRRIYLPNPMSHSAVVLAVFLHHHHHLSPIVTAAAAAGESSTMGKKVIYIISYMFSSQRPPPFTPRIVYLYTLLMHWTFAIIAQLYTYY